MVKLTSYAWDIWQMAKAEHESATPSGLGVEIGLACFMANVRAGEALNPGADLDWVSLKGSWDAMSNDEQVASIGEYNRVTDNTHPLRGKKTAYNLLAEAFTAGDKDAFEAIIAESTEASKAE